MQLLEAIPAGAKRSPCWTVPKKPGSQGEPLYMGMTAALANAGRFDMKVIGGRHGLGSKDTPPEDIFSVFAELDKAQPQRRFTVGINDDVTGLSLKLRQRRTPLPPERLPANSGVWAARDGTVAPTKTP